MENFDKFTDEIIKTINKTYDPELHYEKVIKACKEGLCKYLQNHYKVYSIYSSYKNLQNRFANKSLTSTYRSWNTPVQGNSVCRYEYFHLLVPIKDHNDETTHRILLKMLEEYDISREVLIRDFEMYDLLSPIY